MAWLVLSSVLLAIFVLALSLVTFSLARQIGVLHERTQPVASELRTVAVEEGAMLEKLDVPAHQSVETVSLLFVTTSCPVCRMLHATFSEANQHSGAFACLLGVCSRYARSGDCICYRAWNPNGELAG